MSRNVKVFASETTITLPSYLPAAPDKNPMFLEKRVYQGSSGKVTVNLAPPSARFSARTVPPCPLTMPRTSARPRPWPDRR